MSKIPVIEIFGPVIQGEGHIAGHQTVFIRFGGCDYRCKMCDSMHAVDKVEIRKRAVLMTQDEIFRATLKQCGRTQLVTFSGGNPCLWDLWALVRFLKEAGKQIAVETQGTYWKPWVKECDVITVSPKGPGMGEKFEPDRFDDFLRKLSGHSGLNIKVVVFDKRDIAFAKEIRPYYQDIPFYISIGNPYLPGTGISRMQQADRLLDRYRNISDWVMETPLLADAIVLPQLHVLAYGNEEGR